MVPKVAFNSLVSDLIRRRFSCRTFSERAFSIEKKVEMDAFLDALSAQAPDRIRLQWIDKKELLAEQLFTSGTYGMIKGSRYFVAAIVRRELPGIWEDTGTLLETAVLKMTEWEIDSCWIGGVFDRKRFGKHLDLKEGETIPVVIAVGYGSGKTSWRDRFVRWSARGELRKPFAELFFTNDFGHPFPFDPSSPISGILENVRLAPSASNKQPWRIVHCPPRFHFFLDRDRFYSRLTPHADLQRIDMGIARCHFQFSAIEADIHGSWQNEDPRIPGRPENFAYVFSFRVQD